MANMRQCQGARVCRRPKDCLAERRCSFVASMELHLEKHPEDDPMLQPMRHYPWRPLFVMPPNAPVVCCASDSELCADDCILHHPLPLEDNVIQFPWSDELEEEPA